MATEAPIPELVPEKMLDAESKVISCEQLVETALEPMSTESEQTPQEKANILKAEEPAENIMTDYKISEDQIGNISGKEIVNGNTEAVTSENTGEMDGLNNPSSAAENITMDAPSYEDDQQKGRPASEKLDNAAESVSDEQAGENALSLDADENASKKHSDFASSDNLLKESETKGMELAACREDRCMERDHDAETMLIRPELKEGNIQEDRTKEEEIQKVAADPNIKNNSMTFENVEGSGDSGHKEKGCGRNDAIQSTEEETQQAENTIVIAMVTEKTGRQKPEQEHEKLEQKVDTALQERSVEPDETSCRVENIEDTKTKESSMLASEIPTASKRYETEKDSPAEKPAELPVVQALVREILQKGETEGVKLKEEEKNAKEDIITENVAAEMIEQEKSDEPPPPEAAVEAKDNKKLDEKVECGNEMADAREKQETEIPAAAEIKETKLNAGDINLQKAELEHKKLEQDAAIAVAAKSHETKETSISAEEVGGMEIEKASSAVSEVPSVGKGENTDMESPEKKSGELPVIQTLVKEILQKDEIQENKQENLSQSISETKNPEEIVMTEDVTVEVPLTEIPVEKAQDNENSNKKVDHCCYKITQENIESKIPGEADILGKNPCVPDASPTSQNEDNKQANRVSETLSGESELSMANEGANISETVEAMPAKASELQPEDQEVQRMAEVETRIGEDSGDDNSEKVFQEFSELKTDEKELESVNVSLKTDDLPVMHALVEESLQQGEIKGNKPEKAAQAAIEEKSAESIIMTENAAANVPEEEKPINAHPFETPAKEDIGNLDGKEPTVEVPDKEDTQNSRNLQNQKGSHGLETTDATGETETEILVDGEIHDRNLDVSPAEPVAEQTSSLEEQRKEPNIIPETASKKQNFDASSSWSSEIEHEKVTIVSDGPTKGQETDTNTEAEASCSQTRIDDSSVQKLHKSSELKSEEEKMTSVPENEMVDDQNPFENETQVEKDVRLQKEAEYEKLGEAEPAKTEITTVNKIHIAENESPSSVETLLEQTAEAAPSIGSEENPAKTCEETAATAGTSLQVKERESDTLDKTKEMAEPCSKQDESDVEKLDITYDVTPKELKAAGESAGRGKEVLGKEEISPQEGRKEMKLLEHEAAGLQNVSDLTTNQTPNEEQNSRAIDPTGKIKAEEAKDEENLYQKNDNSPASSVEAEETMQKERSGTLDEISNIVPDKQRDTFDANKNVQFGSSREEDTVPDKLKESVSEDKGHDISTATGEDEAEEKISRAVALEEMKATDSTTSKSSDLTENMQEGKELDSRDKSENSVSSEDQNEIPQKDAALDLLSEKNREEQYQQIEELAGTVSDRLRTMDHSEETERERLEGGMVIGHATATDENVEKSLELDDEQKPPKRAIPEPEDEDLSSNMNDNSETTIPHKVSEEPQAAGASDNIENKTDIKEVANEHPNALPASCKTPNETIGEDEKKHQEATSQLYAEEWHCKANDNNDSTKEGHNEEDKDSHVVPEERDFSTVVSNNNVETVPLRIANNPNEMNDASSIKNASTDELLVTEPDRIEATSGGADSRKKTVVEDTILECASITPAQDESLAESQWTKLEGATPDYKSEDQSLKANDTFKVLDEEVCEAAGAHEHVEGQTTKEDSAVRDLDASVTNVALEENFEDEHKKLEGTPQTTVEDQPYKVNNATDPINSNQNKEVTKGSILVSKEQEFQTTDLAEEIETLSSIGEQNPKDIADASSVETTSTENMLTAVSKRLSTASGDQETQGIDKQIIHEDVTGQGVDDIFIQYEPAPKTQIEKAKSKQEVEDQSSQADNEDKIPNKEVCQIAGATQEDGSTKDLDASSTMDLPVDDNFPEDKKLEEGKTQAEDHIYRSNDTFDLTTASKNEEVKASEVVPGKWEFEETGPTEIIGTMLSMGDNKLNEMTGLSPVTIISTQSDRASEEPETSSKCEDIQKQMIENVDLIGGDREVSIKDETAHESEESQKPKEAVPEVEAQRHHTKDELVHESEESQKLKETIPEAVAQRNHKEYELIHEGRESQKPEEAVLKVETQRFHSEDKPVHESEDSQKLEEVVPEVETQTHHIEDQKVHESEESQKPDEAVLEVEAQRYPMEDEPIHESEESQRPQEVVPEVETERHHKEDEPVYQSKEGQKPEEVIPDSEAQIHHAEDELVHESEDSQKPKEAVPEVEALKHHAEDELVHEREYSQKPKEAVPEVEAQRYCIEDDPVHESEDNQKPKEADSEVGAQRRHMEHEPVHESRENQRPKEAVPEIETQRHHTEEPIHESQENQKSEKVVPDVGTQICHAEDEKVHENEENQKPKEVVTEVEAQRHHMENELFHESEESQRPEEAVLEVETQRPHMEDEPAHESKESQRLEEVVPEVEAQRQYIKDELFHESEESQKPKKAIPEFEAQKHHTDHEPVHEKEESQKPEEVVLEIETQRHDAKDELMHENKESPRPEKTIPEVEAQIHHTEDEIVHESEESQKPEEVVLEVKAQRHHTEDNPDHKSEESQKPEEVVPDIKAQSYHTVDVSGGHETNVENKDTVMQVVEDVAIKDLNVSTAKDASVEENFHEDLKEQEKLEKPNDTTQNRGNKEESGGYETIIENKDTETHVVEEEVAIKNLSPSTKDASVEGKFNENLKEQEKEKLEARPVLEVEDKAFEGNDATKYGQNIEVNSAELTTNEQELKTRALIEKVETNTTISDKGTKEIIDTPLAEATSVENLLYASSEVTVTNGGNDEEIEKQMIEEECTIKSASISEELLQEREPKKLNGETPELEAYHSYKIDDMPEITDLNIKVSKGLEAASKFENVEKQTIEEDRHVEDINNASNQHKAADNFLQKQEEQKRPNEATCHSEGEGQQSEVNDTSHTNDNGRSEEARASNLLPIEKDIKTTASTEKKIDVSLESNNNLNQVVNTLTAETPATQEDAQEEGEKHLEATSFVSNEQEIKDGIQVIIPKEGCIYEKIEVTMELVSEEQVPTKIEVPLPDVNPCKTVDAFHDSPPSIQEFTEKVGPHVEVDEHIKEATDVSESTKSFVLTEEKNTNATEIEQLEKTPELGPEVIMEQTIILDKRENEMGKKDEILYAEMERNGTVSEELQNPSRTPLEGLETAVMSVNTETQIIEKKEVSTNHDTAYFEVEEAKQTVSENENKSMEVEKATAEWEPEGLHHETKEVNVNTVKGVSIKETYSEVEEAGSSKDVEQNVEEVKDANEEKVEAATADLEPVGPNCETKETNYITVKGDSIEEASLEVQVGGSSKDIEQKVEEEKVEEATANFEADSPSCQTKEANDCTLKGLSIKEASLEVEVDESSKDIEQKAEEGKEADKGEAEEPTDELKAEGLSHQTNEANNSTVKDVSIKKASLEVEAASSSKSSGDNEQITEEEEEGKKENDGDATAELEPEGPRCGTKEVNIPVEGVPIDFMASSEPAAAGTSNDIEQRTEEEKEAKKEKAGEATAELEPEGPSCEAKEANDTTVKGASVKKVSSELVVDGSSKDRGHKTEEEKEAKEEKVKEAKAKLKPSDEMKQSNDITTKGSSVDETYSEIEEAGSSKDVEQNVEEVKDAKEEKVKAATADLEPVGPNCETKETNRITVKGDSIEEASLEVQVGGSSKDIEQKVEEEKVEEATANFEADGPSCQTKEANDYTLKGHSIKEASLEVEVDESSKDIEQKAEEGKEADKGEAEEPTDELKAEGLSHQTNEANNSTVKNVSIKKASLEVEAASSSKSSGDNEQIAEEEEEGKKENDGDATAELEPEGPSCGTKEVNILVEGIPIDFMAPSELAAAGTSNDIEQRTEEEKEAKKEKAGGATAELEPEGPSCEAEEANDTTVKEASIKEVSSELEVDGSSKDREQKVEEEKVNEATAELKTKGQSCETNHENDITIKGFSIDKVSSELEGDGSSNKIVEEEKEAKGEKVEEATAELKPTSPSSKVKEANDITVEESSIKKVSSEFEVDGSTKDSEQKVEEEQQANELDAVSVGEVGPSFETKYGEDTTKNAMPNEKVKDFNSALTEQRLQTLETTVPDDKNDLDTSIVGREETNIKDNDILNRISDISAAIESSSDEILQKENATDASCSEPEEQNHAKVDGKEATVPATEQAAAEEIFLKEVEREQLKEAMNDETNDTETSKCEGYQHTGLASSPVPNASATKVVENEGTKPDKTSNLVSEKIQDTIGVNNIKGTPIPMPEEARDFSSTDKEKDQKTATEEERETSKFVLEEQRHEEIHPEETTETANEEISERNICVISAAHKSEGQHREVPDLGIEASSQEMVTAIDCKDPSLAESETTTLESKEGIGNFVILHNSASDEKIHDAVLENKEVESSTLRTDESLKKSFDDLLFPPTSGEEISQKEDSKKNAGSTEILQANSSDPLSDLGEPIERTAQKALTEDLKLGESSQVEPELKQDKVEEERQDGTAEKRMETTTEDLIEEQKESDAGKVRLFDLLERSKREKIKLPEGLVHEGHQAGKEDEVQNIQAATGQVDEEKTEEEEDDDHKKDESGSDAPVIVEPARDADLKPTHKKSHNILSGVGSKVKHSIAKVKKAITGKSTHSKSQSPK